jgi:hypothetical protein
MCASFLSVPANLVTAREEGVFRSYRINGVPAASIVCIPVISTVVHMALVSLIIWIAGVRLYGGVAPTHVVGFIAAAVLSYAACAGIGTLCGLGGLAQAATGTESWVAQTPHGFVPLSLPGKVVKVSAKGDVASFMQKNQIWPKAEVARRLLERALTELTGAPNLVEAIKRFIHKDDIVAIKPNGIAGSGMSTAYELILPLVEACIASGVPATRITVYEQFSTYLLSTRVGAPKYDLPKGTAIATHNNKDFPMPGIAVYEGITTKYCRQLTDATAVINVGLVKDHGICGYTGALKNITHGSINNPEAHHAHFANPQIAMLYAHPVVTSRARLHIADGFRLMYDRGPLLKDPNAVVPHGAVYAATDPVALDAVGAQAVDNERKNRKLRTLAEAGRAPKYIQTAAELGLGLGDLNRIRVQSVEV